MPRFAIKQARALHTIYRDADDVVDAINLARRALVDHAKHGELDVYRVPDKPYDERDAQSELRYEETDADRESEAFEGFRRGLGSAVSHSEEVEPW